MNHKIEAMYHILLLFQYGIVTDLCVYIYIYVPYPIRTPTCYIGQNLPYPVNYYDSKMVYGPSTFKGHLVLKEPENEAKTT